LLIPAFLIINSSCQITRETLVGLAMKRKNDLGDKADENRIDVDKPLWSQDTYLGRWMHYNFITDCRTVLVPKNKLWEAKKLCEDYK